MFTPILINEKRKKKEKGMQFTVSAEFLLQQNSKESKKLTRTGAGEHEVSRNGQLIRLRLVLSWTLVSF